MASETVLPQSSQLALTFTSVNEDSCGTESSKTLDRNWQSNYGTICERNTAMVNNDLMSDVTFVVGMPGRSQRIPAHKYVLATGSSVFYAMFYGEFAESVVEVPDVEPVVFLSMLKYLYSDEIILEEESVLPMLYISKKYMLPFLTGACVNFLHSSLTPANVCLLLSQSRLFEEPSLIEHCWDVIEAQTEQAFRSETVCDVDKDTLTSILGRDTLTCREIDVYSAAVAWASAECKRRDLDPTPENRRSVLGDAFHLLRIPTMTLTEYATGPAQSGLLTKDETIAIFFHITCTAKPQLNFPVKTRMGLKIHVCHRYCKYTPASHGNSRLNYRSRCDSIKFTVDRRIFVLGFHLFGSVHGTGEYTVKIELKRRGKVVAQRNTYFASDGSPNTFPVYFDHPVKIDSGISYSALAMFDGGPLRYLGTEGKPKITVDRATFKFQLSLDVPDGLGVLCGQIPDLVFYSPNNDPLTTNKTVS